MKYKLTEKATVYSTASATSPIVIEVQPGDEINVGEIITNGGERWHDVTLLNGKAGYISAKTKAVKAEAEGTEPKPPPIPSKSLSPEDARAVCARQTLGDQLSKDLICPKCADSVKRGTGHITDQKWLPIAGGGAGLLLGMLASSLPRSSNAADAMAGGAIVGAKAGFWGAIAGMVLGFVCAAVFCPSYHCARCGALRLSDFPDIIRKRELLFRWVAPPVIIVLVFAVIAIYVLVEYKHF